MANCGGKIKQNCTKVYSPCVQYELDIPEFSTLSKDTPCVSIEETTKDLYEHVGDIKEEIDLSDIGKQCLTYLKPNEALLIKDVLYRYETELCTLREKVKVLEEEAICDKDITKCGIDLPTLCDTPITTLGEFMQYVLNNEK